MRACERAYVRVNVRVSEIMRVSAMRGANLHIAVARFTSLFKKTLLRLRFINLQFYHLYVSLNDKMFSKIVSIQLR